MSVSSLALNSAWRDYWGSWNPMVEPLISPLELSKCHGPRYALVPSLDQSLFTSSGKIQYNFHLPSGSLIWGILVQSDCVIQLTDVGTGHQLFQEPVACFAASYSGFVEGGNVPSYFLLPTPWPVTGDGFFTFEAWAVPNAQPFTEQRILMLLGVAEATTCPVR